MQEFTQVSPFLSMVTKGYFSWHAFSNIWKHLLFTGDGFAGAQSIDSVMLSFIHETFLEMAPSFKSISAYFCFRTCVMCPKSGFTTKVLVQKLQRFSGKMAKAEFVVVFMKEKISRTLTGYSYFLNALLIFIIFRSEYGRAIMVGMYAVTLA